MVQNLQMGRPGKDVESLRCEVCLSSCVLILLAFSNLPTDKQCRMAWCCINHLQSSFKDTNWFDCSVRMINTISSMEFFSEIIRHRYSIRCAAQPEVLRILLLASVRRPLNPSAIGNYFTLSPVWSARRFQVL